MSNFAEQLIFLALPVQEAGIVVLSVTKDGMCAGSRVCWQHKDARKKTVGKLRRLAASSMRMMRVVMLSTHKSGRMWFVASSLQLHASEVPASHCKEQFLSRRIAMKLLDRNACKLLKWRLVMNHSCMQVEAISQAGYV
jgi:hypothetical protein